MNILRALLVILLATCSFSDQGLVLRFTIEKSDGSDFSYRYENAVLVSFDKEHSFQIPNQYELVVVAENISPNKARVRFEYSDIQGDKPKFIDKYENLVIVDESVSITQPKNLGKSEYKLTLISSYGELP
ncbi:hypothetical protein [Reinekea sp.]|jgi:hypothetical protein|uniref:hypothetical protein n=1 Tax=Reinekea sp. TaxID=1970455 RepID=UPI003989DF1E